MKILGLEIKRAATAAEPSPVSVPKANQQTQPSRPLRSSFPRAELGDSGTRMMHGIITEEYNPQLQGIQGVRVFDEMRKSDGTVRAAVLVTTLPVRRAKWFVNPVDQETSSKEIASFVEHALFDWLDDMTWDDVIRQALLMVAFGVMVFEKVYGIKEFDGKSYVTIKKLAPRMPRSIQQWELPDHTFGIQQIRQDGVIANIPGSKLLVFVNEREGDNYWGTSMLRAAYKHWYYKNNFYKIDAVAFERQGLGVPKIKMPDGYTESDERKATQAMQNLRANENAYLLLPPGYEAEFMNMGSQTTRDPSNSIDHHNREILKSVLAQFLELGSSKSGGSRALSEDHSDLFLKAEEAIANTIIAEINKNLIPELVDLNFNDIAVYPTLDYSGITKIDVQALGSAYSQLVTAGAITPTDEDQQYIRIAMGLPPRTQDDMDGAEDDTAEEKSVDNPSQDNQDNGTEDDTQVEDANTKVKNEPTDKQQSKQMDKATRKSKTRKASTRIFDDGNGFMSWRPLIFTEQKVSWKKIEDTMDKMESGFSDEAKKLLTSAKDAFMAKLHAAIDSGDQKGIADLEIKFIADYKALLKDVMKSAYEYGKNNVSTEIGVQVPPNSAASLANIDLLADTIANKTAADLETKAKITTANAVKQGKNPLQTAGIIDLALQEAIASTVDNTAGLIIGQSINTGRNDVFARNKGSIHGLMRSEILDASTCEFCLSMDGRVVGTEDTWASTDIFHTNCRGIWVAIMKDEQNPPAVTGIPNEVGQYYGGQPNALVQPKNAIVDPQAPAAGEVQRRKAEKDAKKK